MATSPPCIAAYRAYLPEELLQCLRAEAVQVGPAVPGMSLAPGLRDSFPTVESDDALRFVAALYDACFEPLDRVLQQRVRDRAFIDRVTAETAAANKANGVEFTSPAYATVIGACDTAGRTVVGPTGVAGDGSRMVHVPHFMRGAQVTLFGPPDSAKMTINAMNSLHRRLPGEAPLVSQLVEASGDVPRWGADSEDSKTPMPANMVAAQENLRRCFSGDIDFVDEKSGRKYALAKEGTARPIKRFVGLALPDSGHMMYGEPLPLHLVDFGLHMFHNAHNPEALVFYVPKLENEEEAAYLRHMIATAEQIVQEMRPELCYVPGTVRTILVFENPRAIFRVRAMADALHPYFLGGSLGWHDYLASAARLFKNDPEYRIPVKADPNIVIENIRESHHILVDALSPIGALKIGGMYGVLYEDGNSESFEASIVGYVKDVVTQLRRGLDGFWVAHPGFVRIGIALVEAWRRLEHDKADESLRRLVTHLVPNPTELDPLLAFIDAEDARGLSKEDPRYARSVLAADIQTSAVISNSDQDEVRYNIFQALQYITDWLGGNGCVALPASLVNKSGKQVFVRIMDDLATTERSRWELWHEVHHGRVSVTLFEKLLAEETEFIRLGIDSDVKRVQVEWVGEASRWYPVAVKLLRVLVRAECPVEFASELMLPFTLRFLRDSADPWVEAVRLAPTHFAPPLKQDNNTHAKL